MRLQYTRRGIWCLCQALDSFWGMDWSIWGKIPEARGSSSVRWYILYVGGRLQRTLLNSLILGIRDLSNPIYDEFILPCAFLDLQRRWIGWICWWKRRETFKLDAVYPLRQTQTRTEPVCFPVFRQSVLSRIQGHSTRRRNACMVRWKVSTVSWASQRYVWYG